MKWTNVADKALREVSWEGKTFVELSGVIGGEERRHTYTRMIGGGLRADVTAPLEEIGERFSWQVTAANHRQIMEACEARGNRCWYGRDEQYAASLAGR